MLNKIYESNQINDAACCDYVIDIKWSDIFEQLGFKKAAMIQKYYV